MAAIRISPGVYQVNGKTVRANTAAEAEKMAGGGNKQQGGNKGANPGKGQQQAAPPPLLKPNTEINNVSQGVEAERTVQGQNAVVSNPNINNSFGSQTVTYDANGQPTVNQTLSPEQQGILQGGQALTNLGQNLATDQLNNGMIGRTSTGDLNADRARIEQAQYGRLTQNLDKEFNQAKAQTEQTLYNRGVGFNDQVNNPAMEKLGQDLAQARAQAQLSAVATGGEEYQRNVAINEQQRANDVSRAGALSQLGTGLVTPNFQPYQAPNPLSSPVDINASLEGIKQGNRQLNIAQQSANRVGGGGGGGGGQPAAPNAFSNSAPPGYS